MSDTLRELARPFPDKYVHTNPSGGGSYIKHHVINQRLIQVLGVPPHFTLTEIVRGDVPAIAPNPSGNSKRAKEGRPPLTNVVVGVIARMQVTIDDETVLVDEAGDCEEPHNWTTDGQRLKDAMSDAYKRCAMRLGCGLHLWSQDEFFLYEQLAEREQGESQRANEAGVQAPLNPSSGTKGLYEASPPRAGEVAVTRPGESPAAASSHNPDDDWNPPKSWEEAKQQQVPDVPACDVCGGEMWDNRPDKAAGKRKPTFPDFKCKDKACNNAKWVVAK